MLSLSRSLGCLGVSEQRSTCPPGQLAQFSELLGVTSCQSRNNRPCHSCPGGAPWSPGGMSGSVEASGVPEGNGTPPLARAQLPHASPENIRLRQWNSAFFPAGAVLVCLSGCLWVSVHGPPSVLCWGRTYLFSVRLYEACQGCALRL